MERKREEEKKGMSTRMHRITSLTVIGLMLVMLCVLANAASAAHISVEPSFQTVSSGENFTVNITINPEGNAIGGVDYILCFNNTLLNATSLTQGTFFNGFTTGTFGEGINNTPGTIDYGEYIQGSGGVSTSGMLITIVFQAIADYGTSELCFDETWTQLSGPDGGHISTNVSNGSVRIGFCGDVTLAYGTINLADVMALYSHVARGTPLSCK